MLEAASGKRQWATVDISADPMKMRLAPSLSVSGITISAETA